MMITLFMAASGLLLADVDSRTVLIVGVVTLFIKELFDFLKSWQTNNRVKELSTKVDTRSNEIDQTTKSLGAKADAAADKAEVAAGKAEVAASKAAQATAATVAVYRATKAQDEKLLTIEKQTNGVVDTLREQLADAQARLDAALALLTQEGVAAVSEAAQAAKAGRGKA